MEDLGRHSRSSKRLTAKERAWRGLGEVPPTSAIRCEELTGPNAHEQGGQIVNKLLTNCKAFVNPLTRYLTNRYFPCYNVYRDPPKVPPHNIL